MMPEGWKLKPLGEISSIQRGKFSVRPRNDPRYYGGTTPFIQTGDITRSNGRLECFSQTLNEGGVGVSKVFPAGTILMTIAANIGDVAMTTFEVACPDSVVAIRPGEGIDGNWLLHFLQTQKSELESKAPQNAQKNINLQTLSPLPVLVPPLPEQRRIATILTSVDEAIQATQSVIDQTRRVKEGLHQHLLTKGIDHTKFKQTRIGQIPETWEVVQLHTVADVQTGVAKGKKDVRDPIEMPYLRVANVQDGYLDLSEVKCITVSRKDVSRYSLKSGDVLLTEGGDLDKLGRGAVWRGQIKQCLHQNHVFAVRTRQERLIPQFFSLLAGSLHGKTYFLGCGKQTTNLASINSTQLKEFPVLLPALEEQQEIVRTMASIEFEEEQNLAAADALERSKKGLMQDLLSGRTRVNERTEP